MNIYFAVSDVMIEEQGMPTRFQDADTYNYTLSQGKSEYGETFLAHILGRSVGEVVDAVGGFVQKPYIVCRAEIDDGTLTKALRAALVGDVMWVAKVIVNELTRIE
jgi:hypothetical protein